MPQCGEAPKRLRRITINEAARLQTFPVTYIFKGRKSSVYRQIGNAVPCLLAGKVAQFIKDTLFE
ncbi:MAG: DNA cytosine methyltransferase [Christensenellaceae bacterium]|nr:DNA cytosine methyltransferase [Christensenellaceae bacterium]